MAKFEITTAEGERFEVEMPDEEPGLAQELGAGALSGFAKSAGTAANLIGAGLNFPAFAAGELMGGPQPPGLSPEQTLRGVTDPQALALEQLGARETGGPAFTAADIATQGLLTGGPVGLARGAFGAEALSALGGGAGAGLGQAVGGDVGSLIGGLAGSAATPAAAGGLRGLLRGLSGDDLAQSAAAMRAAGIEPTVGQASGSGTALLLEKLSGFGPGGNIMQRRRALRQIGAVQGAVRRVASRLDPDAGAEAGGQAIQRGIADFRTRLLTKGNKQYGEVRRLIGRNAQGTLTNTRAVADELVAGSERIAETRGAISRSFGRLTKIMTRIQELDAQGLSTFDELQTLRSDIGEELASNAVDRKLSTKQLRALYTGITKDLRQSVANSPGSEKALALFDQANRDWHDGFNRLEKVLEPLVRNRTPEKTFNAVQLRGREGPTAIRDIRKSLSKEQWNTVLGATVDRLGRARPDSPDFEVGVFLRQWEAIPRGTKAAMFKGAKRGQMLRDLDVVADAAKDLSDRARAFQNPSGTAPGLINAGVGAVGLGGVIGSNSFAVVMAAAATALSSGTQWVMQSPRFVNWLASSTRIPIGTLPAHMAKLDKIAKDEPQSAGIIQQLVNDF